jgi:CBS domain-containing protein
MGVRVKPLSALTAADVMSRDVVRIPQDMPLRDAGRLLLQERISGAPVVDARGNCVGVLSALDLLRCADKRAEGTGPPGSPAPRTCPFQVTHRRPHGDEVTLCLLPPGVCPVQVRQEEPEGKELLLCGEPHCILVDWQVVNPEKLPANAVRHFMTTDPVTARSTTPLRTLARRMLDAHIHRVIVVDAGRKPVGIVSSTDLLAALAYGGTEPERRHDRTGA